MLTELDTYDWAEVFGEGNGGNCTPIRPNIRPGDEETSKETFSREDVELIRGQIEGENDGASWIVYGKLKDGRWFVAAGSCDYTGWDCQAGNHGYAASSEDEIVRFGLDKEERERLNVVLSDF